MKHGDGIADNIDAEALARVSPNQHAIPGTQILIGMRLHVDRIFSVLNEEIDVAAVVIGDGGLKGNGASLTKVRLAEGADGFQGGNRSGLGGDGSPGARKNERKREQHDLPENGWPA